MSLKSLINLLILSNMFNFINCFEHYKYYNNKNCNKQLNKKTKMSFYKVSKKHYTKLKQIYY